MSEHLEMMLVTVSTETRSKEKGLLQRGIASFFGKKEKVSSVALKLSYKYHEQWIYSKSTCTLFKERLQ